MASLGAETEANKGHGKHPRADMRGDTIMLSGAWTTRHAGIAEQAARKLARDTSGGKASARFDCSAITSLDTAGAWLVVRLARTLTGRGDDAQDALSGLSAERADLVQTVARTMPADGSIPDRPARSNPLQRTFFAVGEMVSNLASDGKAGLHIIGAAVRGPQMKEGHSNPVSLTPVVAQVDKTGVRAIPIILLISTIIGAIIAQQGAFQLRYFGAEIFVVDLVSILVLREIGVLITAIMIAGRSGSAITAEIGSMRMREEVDALTVIGLNPIGVLVFPRLVALMISLPALTFMANMAALAGAMMVAQAYSGISPEAFITRTRDAIDLTTFFAGIIKAPFMAVIIGVIASVEGLKVGGSAESLGSHVTASVVKAIFVVIVVDGMFAIFFAAIDF